MDESGLDARYRLAVAMAREAGDMLLALRRDPIEVSVKGAQDFVTRADGAVETFIRATVARHFPDDAVLGEEQGGTDAERVWVVDPIDGTINFIRGIAAYAVSIAFVHRGVVELGAIRIPLLGETFAARCGRGALCNEAPIRVSACASLGTARIAAGYAQRGSKAAHLGVLKRLLRAGSDIVKVNSAAYCLAMTACGRIDGYCERELMSWDVLAGLLLVREAGGLTGAFGAGGLLARDHVVAAGPALFDALTEVAR